jgi:DNA-binding LytR/AlgR family response regulator
MVNFAFCYEREDELNFVKNEIQKCFKIRDIEIALKAYRNAYELLRCLSCNCPDVLFYDYDGEDGLIHKAASAAKKENTNLITVITRNNDYIYCDDEPVLKPVYTLPSMNRKHLWMYACLAYDAFLDDSESFTYYVRPDYMHIPIKEVMYFASEGRRTHIVSHTHRDTFYQKLDEIEEQIGQKKGHFIRIHKSYLVNSMFISSYCREFVTLINGEKLRISKYDYYRMLHSKAKNSDITAKRVAGYC